MARTDSIDNRPAATEPENVPLDVLQKRAGVLVALGYLNDTGSVARSFNTNTYYDPRFYDPGHEPPAPSLSADRTAPIEERLETFAAAGVPFATPTTPPHSLAGQILLDPKYQPLPELSFPLFDLERLQQDFAAIGKPLQELAATARDRFGIGGNSPPEQIEIEQAASAIRAGEVAAGVLRKEIASPNPQAAVVELAYWTLKQASAAITTALKWLGGKVGKFVDAAVMAAGTAAGPLALLYALEKLDAGLPSLIERLAPLIGKLLGN